MPSPHEIFSALVRDRNVVLEPARRFGPLPRHLADVWRPAGAEAGPVAMFLYGGSWRSGLRSCYAFAGAAFAAKGITCVMPDYRLYPQVRFPAFNEDAALAYGWIVKEVAHGRPVVVMGHSAGAHIAALLALDPRYVAEHAAGAPPPAGLVGISGPYSFDPTTWPTTAEIFATAPSADLARPVAYASPDAPPALLVHGGADEVVKPKNTHDLADALRAAGASVAVDMHARLGHAGTLLALSRPFRWRAPVLANIVHFVRPLA